MTSAIEEKYAIVTEFSYSLLEKKNKKAAANHQYAHIALQNESEWMNAYNKKKDTILQKYMKERLTNVNVC